MTNAINRRTFLAGAMGLLLLLGFTPSVSLLVGSAQAQPAKPVDDTAEESWQVIYIGKKRVGYGHSRAKQIKKDGRTIVQTHSDSHMKLVRFGQTLNVHTTLQTDEALDGALIRFEYETRNPPAKPNRTVGIVHGTRMELKVTVNGQSDTVTVPIPQGVKSPAYAERVLRTPPLKPSDRRSFEAFEISFNKAGKVRFEAQDLRSVDLLDGKRRNLLKVKMSQSVAPTMKTTHYLNETGESLRSDVDMLGMTMSTYTVPKGVALQEIVGAELDLAVKTLVRVKRIRKGHATSRAVYRIKTKGVDPSKRIVNGGTQVIKKTGPDEIILTVSAIRPKPQIGRSTTDPKFTAASRFLQTGDRLVRQHANRAAGNERDPWRIAKKMEEHVSRKLAKKNFSTALASAAEVAKNLEGDCTEHAVLLAAMLRVKQIPSRLCVGMVYIERDTAFGGHMWTEAFIGGRWIPLDATLGRGGIGAAHIKLVETSFADGAADPATAFIPLLDVLGKMEIDVVESQ